MEYNIGDIVRTKKKHPCGSKLWEITRMLPREKAIKAITKIEKKSQFEK